MSPARLLTLLLLLLLVFTLLADDVEAARRRRRRRRKHRLAGGEGAAGAAAGAVGARRIRRIRHASGRRAEFVRRRLRKARMQQDVEGNIRLVDGRADFEGNVQIFHNNRWGNICDDEWDKREGEIVCKMLGFPGLKKVTHSGRYGHVRGSYWMDNLFCYGTEEKLSECRFDGWGTHDCELDESAGVVCETHFSTTTVAPTLPPRDEPVVTNKTKLSHAIEGKTKLRLLGGRSDQEGRVEVMLPGSNGTWGLICGDGWSLLEGMVACRQLGMHYAQAALSTGYFGGNMSNVVISGIKCHGNEDNIDQCLHEDVGDVFCPHPGSDPNIAGVTCVSKIADLVPDHLELARSAHLEDKQLFFLQCAMEENCLAQSAVKAQESGYGWHLDTRRLLRFTARIVNQGNEAFRPILPKQYWEWHACHMHYHSMEVFAHYDVIDADGNRVAEGHKASFCLEDNNCVPGVEPVFKCANFGDQGISPGCTDTYAYNIDCQWIDITDIKPGTYTFKLAINPEFKVGEMSFDNNAAVCEFIYTKTSVWLGNCTLTRP
ncbi:lysyl oxidase homolog 3A-like isoform X1 [Penaeus monodon]|uniref:lysyl oxidase homolog 3A-like isoform X1 n=1 Tax=Penaeus monodon TaxID=6687 RepID=UPI0018A76C70|nr:lysyl oxidase homolog 3A-like isoform X1 [Penaeus monodon]